MSDYIESLPSDETPLTDTESVLLSEILKSDDTPITKFFRELREPLIIAVMFILMSLSQITDLIGSAIPYSTSSTHAMMGIKCALIIGAWFVYKNFSLTKSL